MSRITRTLFAGTFVVLTSLAAGAATRVQAHPAPAAGPALACSDLSFSAAAGAPFATGGTTPFQVATVDFNGDNVLDLATTNQGSNTVSVLLGNGSGGFSLAPGAPFASGGTTPYGVVAGDFNGDTHPDLAVTNQGSNSVAVFLGNGAGGFNLAAGSPITVAVGPAGVATGDFTSDNKLDLVLLSHTTGGLTILLGDGTGGFALHALFNNYYVGISVYNILVTDLNRDGRQDLAFVNYANTYLSVWLGDGTGHFARLALSTRVAAGPITMVAADFNGDSTVDLATANAISNTVTILLGTGGGGYVEASNSPFSTGGNSPTALAAADLNGDGALDLATTNQGSNTVAVLLGSGTGTFNLAPGAPYATGGSPAGVATNDFNADGRVDLAFVNSTDGTLSVLLNTCSAGPTSTATSTRTITPTRTATPTRTVTITATPPPTNGTPTRTPTCNNLGFSAAAGAPFATGGTTPFRVATADFNGDNVLDLATTNQGNNTVSVLLGNGSGGFSLAPGAPFASGGTTPYGVVAGDFNGDTHPDLAVTNQGSNTVVVFLGTGTGGFVSPPRFYLTGGTGPAGLTTADFNHDNKLDLAIADYTNGDVALLLGDGSGGFSPASIYGNYSLGMSVVSIVAADFNPTTDLDLAVVNHTNGDIYVLLGNGTGGLLLIEPHPRVGAGPVTIVAGDFNGDGISDLATANADANTITIMQGTGGSGFSEVLGSPFSTGGSSPTGLTVADFNGDGVLDLATTNQGSNTVAVLLGSGTGTFSLAPGAPYATGGSPAGLLTGDFNGDGRADLAFVNSTDGTLDVLLSTCYAGPPPTATSTLTVSATTTSTPSVTRTGTVTNTPTVPVTATSTPSVTRTGTVTNTPTVQATLTSTPSVTRTGTTTNTPTPNASRTGTVTNTPTPNASRTGTVTNTPTVPAQATNTPTITATAPSTATVPSTATATPTVPDPTATVTGTPAPLPFRDVATTDWAYTYIQWAYLHDILSGYSDGTFRPGNPTTRGQVAKMIVGAAGWTLTLPPGAPHFSDVPPDSTFYAYIEVAWVHGIITGYSDGTFRPGKNVTRAQLTKMNVLAAGLALVTPATPTFGDVLPDSTFYSYVETAAAHGIVGGYSDGTFRPSNNATRAQFTKILYQAFAVPSR